jgi:hypothetical protein
MNNDERKLADADELSELKPESGSGAVTIEKPAERKKEFDKKISWVTYTVVLVLVAVALEPCSRWS